MTEVWRRIPSWPGYEASNEGRIKSLARVIVRKNGTKCSISERILKPGSNGRGQLIVKLTGGKSKKVSHLVLETFVSPRPVGKEACHWDDDKSNNRLENLRWDTSSANMIDRVRNGRHYFANRTECSQGHPYVESNTYFVPGEQKRRCRTCHRDRQRNYRERKKAATL